MALNVASLWLEQPRAGASSLALYRRVAGPQTALLAGYHHQGEPVTLVAWQPSAYYDGRLHLAPQMGWDGALPPDPLTALFTLAGEPEAGVPPSLRPLIGGLTFEATWPENGLGPPPEPPARFFLPTRLAIFGEQTVTLVAHHRPGEQPLAEADLATIASWLKPEEPLAPWPLEPLSSPPSPGPEIFAQAIAALDDNLQKLVPSVRLELAWQGDPATVYQRLCQLNPSPYSYLLHLGDEIVVGASPELLVAVNGPAVRLRPLAGTRPRGQEGDLTQNPKDHFEHAVAAEGLLKDLEPHCSNIQVPETFTLEHYATYSHLATEITARLKPGATAAAVIKAIHPTGTVGGVPRPAALGWLAQAEPPRGLYTGAIGTILPGGHCELALVIRSLYFQPGGRVRLQAGAGTVAASDPEAEYRECLTKLAPPLAALGYTWAKEVMA